MFLVIACWCCMLQLSFVDVVFSGMGSCTFDRTWCSYHNFMNNSFNWKRVDVETLISTAGPTKDHTTGLGKFLIIYWESLLCHQKTSETYITTNDSYNFILPHHA
jgi:hypothetical protein